MFICEPVEKKGEFSFQKEQPLIVKIKNKRIGKQNALFSELEYFKIYVSSNEN